MRRNETGEWNTVRRWFYLFLCAIVMLFSGVIYAWSILKAPLAEEFCFSSTVLTVNYTLTFCSFCAGGILNGKLKAKVAFRGRLLLASVLLLVGFWVASMLQGAWLLCLGYGILGGLGIGMVYNNVIVEMTAWFPDRQGLCTGILMMGFGASAMVLGHFLQMGIDFNGIGWRGTYRLLGCVICAVSVIAAFFVNQAENEEKSIKNEDNRNWQTMQIPPGRMVKMFSFWAVFLRSITIGCAGSVLINFSRELSLALGAEVALATIVVGLLSVCNGCGRLLFGLLFDLLGYKGTLWISNAVSLIAIFLNLLAYAGNGIALFVVGAVLTGLAYGSMPTFSSAAVADFYGRKYFTQNFSIMNFTLVASSALVICCSLLLDYFGGYREAFRFLLVMIILGCVLSFFIRKPHSDKSE